MKQRDGAHGEGYQNFGSKSMVVTVYRLESTGGFGKPDVYADTDIMKVRIPCEHTCKETTWYREGVCLIHQGVPKQGGQVRDGGGQPRHRVGGREVGALG